jgi:hypothetical protein
MCFRTLAERRFFSKVRTYVLELKINGIYYREGQHTVCLSVWMSVASFSTLKYRTNATTRCPWASTRIITCVPTTIVIKAHK